MIEKKGLSNEFYLKLIILFTVAIFVFSIIGSAETFMLNKELSDEITEKKELDRPAQLKATIISSECPECVSIDDYISGIEKMNVNLEKIEYAFNSDNGKKLIRKYSIKKLPVVIFEGEINKTSSLKRKILDITDEQGEVYISNIVKAPYVDSSNGETKGLVSMITLVDSDCETCFDIDTVKNQLLSNVKVIDNKIVDKNSEEGKELISKYDIKKIPTIILDSESQHYEELNAIWSQIGTIENDLSKVIRQVPPPYFDTEKNDIAGKVKLTIISDKSCLNCYNAKIAFNQISQNIGVKISEIVEVDVLDTSIVEKYNITKVPTVIYQGDLELYPGFIQVWPQAGDEVDGVYVFRNVELLKQPYKDLISGEVIN